MALTITLTEQQADALRRLLDVVARERWPSVLAKCTRAVDAYGTWQEQQRTVETVANTLREIGHTAELTAFDLAPVRDQLRQPRRSAP